MVQSFTYQLKNVISILLLYKTLTATALSIYALINKKIYFNSVPTASIILTLTIALTGATLGRYQGIASQVHVAILAYISFTICIINIPYIFITSSIRLSLFFTAFQFLLYFIYSSQVIQPAYYTTYTTPIHGCSSSPFPRSSSMSFRRSISLCYFWSLLHNYYSQGAPCQVCCGVIEFYIAFIF